MYLRQATREDLNEIYACLRELNKCGVNYFNRNRIKKLLKNKCVAVCVGETLGVMGVCMVVDNYDDTLEVFAIAVNPAYQKGYGVGTKLMNWAEAMARVCGREIVYAHSYSFYNATPFYEKRGYLRQTKEKGIYTFFKYV